MKRPFATVGFTAFALLMLLFYADSIVAAFCVMISFFATGVFSVLDKKFRQTKAVPLCLFTAASVCLLFISFSVQKDNVQSFSGQTVNVEASVSEAPYMNSSNGRHYCILDIDSIDGVKADGRLRLSFSVSKDNIDTDMLRIGNALSFTARVYLPGESEKSISRYFTGENIYLGAYSAENITVTEPSFRSLSYYFRSIRSFVTEKLRYAFSDKTAGLLVGILTGDKSCLDTELYEAFRKTGLAHIMAVSGLHLSIWVLSLGCIFPSYEKYRKIKSVFLILCVVFVMLLSGMSESVKRAGFMLIALLSGELVKRKADSINSLGFAVFLMIIFNPSCVLSTSLQLSFLSTLGIITLGKLYMKRVEVLLYTVRLNVITKKTVSYLLDMFFISISVLVFTFPVLIYNFGGFSSVSAWVNVMISPFIAPLLLLAGVCVVLMAVGLPAFPVAVAVELISGCIVSVTNFFLNFKNAFITFEKENMLLYAAAFVLISSLSVLVLKRNFRSKMFFTAISVIISALLITAFNFTEEDETRIHISSYEDAVVAAVERNSRAVILSDTPTYEKSLFVSAMADKGVAVTAEAEKDHMTKFINRVDGKPCSTENINFFSVKDDTELTVKSRIIEIYGKTAGIFYGEALHNASECDIIIEMLDKGVSLRTEDESFLFTDEGSFILTFKEDGSIILRGENSWQNLMKSS